MPLSSAIIDAKIKEFQARKRKNLTEEERKELDKLLHIRASRRHRAKAKDTKLQSIKKTEGWEDKDKELEALNKKVKELHLILAGELDREKMAIKREEQAALREQESRDRLKHN